VDNNRITSKLKAVKSRRVWVAHRSTLGATYKAASGYGEIRILSQNTAAGKVNQFKDKSLTKRLRSKLSNSAPDDLILLAGYGSIQVLACLIFKEMHGKVNVLIYNQKTRKYEIRKHFGE